MTHTLTLSDSIPVDPCYLSACVSSAVHMGRPVFVYLIPGGFAQSTIHPSQVPAGPFYLCSERGYTMPMAGGVA